MTVLSYPLTDVVSVVIFLSMIRIIISWEVINLMINREKLKKVTKSRNTISTTDNIDITGLDIAGKNWNKTTVDYSNEQNYGNNLFKNTWILILDLKLRLEIKKQIVFNWTREKKILPKSFLNSRIISETILTLNWVIFESNLFHMLPNP